MPHNAVHKQITKLDTLRHEMDGEEAVQTASEIIDVALQGEEVDEGAVAALLFAQFLKFGDKHFPKVLKGAGIGEDLGKEILKAGKSNA